MPLISAPIDVELKITKVFVSGDAKRHLENLGILPGEKVNVIRSVGGSLIVKVKEGRVALDSDMASKIFVA